MIRLSGLLFFVGFAASLQAQDSFHLYLLGDAGEEKVSQVAYRQLLQEQLRNDTPYAIIFLGDNIYPRGLPPAGDKHREESERIIQAQVDLVSSSKGPVYFIPGNHDWKQGRPDGLPYILNQKAWIDSLKDSRFQFFPQQGCPGPEEIPLTDQLVLVIIDTQWFLHAWEKPEGENSPCAAKTAADVFVLLEDIFRRNEGKRVVVAAHHPLISYGEHGGVSKLKYHLFPLMEANKALFIPMPVVGSLYPLYRNVFGNIQDVAHPTYKQMANSFKDVLEQYPGSIYVSGHEHTLQYSVRDSVHYLVSGSGVKNSEVKKKGYAQFASSEIGFTRLSFQQNGNAFVDFYSTDKLFSSEIGMVAAKKKDDEVAQKLIEKGEVRVHGSDRYKASKAHERWLGENYRAEWGQDITVPVFDLGENPLGQHRAIDPPCLPRAGKAPVERRAHLRSREDLPRDRI
ncbi:MAG: metallophosphoesterase, partial [Flammeovirgaceae bacterium]|nr:metallophosphoesterase [Flammeovirgaceae bacterium]